VGGAALVGATTAATVAGAVATAGISAAVGLVVWAISKKGLFRGGEEALYVNPARDHYLLQFGPPGWEFNSGAPVLARALTEMTGPAPGSDVSILWTNLMRADKVTTFQNATRAIRDEFAKYGYTIGAY
jgi:hypothetical protein